MFRGRKANRCANKYTYNKHIEYCQKLHRDRLRKMKPAIDNKPPKRPSHLRNNAKREQMMEERFSKIERENRLLLEKMSHIMQKDTMGLKNTSHAKRGKSLNNPYRKKELQRITMENQHILKRIQRREPTYNHVAWEEDRKVHESYLRNICEYPYQAPPQKGKGKLRSRYLNSGYGSTGQLSRLDGGYQTDSRGQLMSGSAMSGSLMGTPM